MYTPTISTAFQGPPHTHNKEMGGSISGHPSCSSKTRLQTRGRPLALHTHTHLGGWTGSLKQYPPPEQFGKDATHGPHVDGRVVVLAARQELWGPVVLGDHLQCHGSVAVGFDSPGKSKVAIS